MVFLRKNPSYSYVKFSRWSIGLWWRGWFDKPQTEVLEDFLDDVRVLYKTDYFHWPETLGANKGINIRRLPSVVRLG
jgi:hypothetical protein